MVNRERIQTEKFIRYVYRKKWLAMWIFIETHIFVTRSALDVAVVSKFS